MRSGRSINKVDANTLGCHGSFAAGTFSHGDREIFPQLIDNLCNSDPFLVLADYADYVACQERVSAAWQDQDHWTRMSILNTARGGEFSSDRSVREYADNILEV